MITYGSPEFATRVTLGRHPAVQDSMAWMTFTHLPPHLQNITRPLFAAAVELLDRIPNDCAELTNALNRLIDAKNWFVMAGIHSDEGRAGSVSRPQEVVDPPVLTGVVDPDGDPYQERA